jgi:hypothetical protein
MKICYPLNVLLFDVIIFGDCIVGLCGAFITFLSISLEEIAFPILY